MVTQGGVEGLEVQGQLSSGYGSVFNILNMNLVIQIIIKVGR